MTTSRRALIACAVVASLAGCMSHGVQVAPERLAAFERGKTTEADIVRSLGQPTSVTSMYGMRYLTYTGATAQARPATFIPLIGPFVGGADVRSSTVQFQIGPDGVLREIVSSHSQSGSGTGFAAGVPQPSVQDQPRRE